MILRNRTSSFPESKCFRKHRTSPVFDHAPRHQYLQLVRGSLLHGELDRIPSAAVFSSFPCHSLACYSLSCRSLSHSSYASAPFLPILCIPSSSIHSSQNNKEKQRATKQLATFSSVPAPSPDQRLWPCLLNRSRPCPRKPQGNSGDNASERLEQQHRRVAVLRAVSDIAYVDALDMMIVDHIPQRVLICHPL